jgi:hypothetical protein
MGGANRKDSASSKDLIKAIAVSDEIAEHMLHLGDALHHELEGGRKPREFDEPDSVRLP